MHVNAIPPADFSHFLSTYPALSVVCILLYIGRREFSVVFIVCIIKYVFLGPSREHQGQRILYTPYIPIHYNITIIILGDPF